MSDGRSSLFAGVRWHRALVVSLVSLAVGGVVLARTSLPLFGAAVSPSAASLGEAPLGTLLHKHAEAVTLSQQRFNGRSLFFIPPAPPRPVERPRPVETPPPPPPVELPPPEPPGPPSQYAGPKEPFGMLGDKVFFVDGEHLRVGEEDQGVRVVAVNPPWTVTLAWMGGEYEREVTFGTGEAWFRNALDDPVAVSGAGAAQPAGAARDAVRDRTRATPTRGVAPARGAAPADRQSGATRGSGATARPGP